MEKKKLLAVGLGMYMFVAFGISLGILANWYQSYLQSFLIYSLEALPFVLLAFFVSFVLFRIKRFDGIKLFLTGIGIYMLMTFGLTMLANFFNFEWFLPLGFRLANFNGFPILLVTWIIIFILWRLKFRAK
jgi:hypothetical protein